MSDKPVSVPVKKPSFMCIACSGSEDEVAFWTAKDLFVHEKSGHTTKGVVVELPPAVPVTPSATEQDPSLGTVPKTATEQQPAAVSEPKPLELTYKWIGAHKVCNSEPRTLVMEIGNGDMWAIAYCANCDMKIAEHKVEPLFSAVYKTPKDNTFEKNVKPKK